MRCRVAKIAILCIFITNVEKYLCRYIFAGMCLVITVIMFICTLSDAAIPHSLQHLLMYAYFVIVCVCVPTCNGILLPLLRHAKHSFNLFSLILCSIFKHIHVIVFFCCAVVVVIVSKNLFKVCCLFLKKKKETMKSYVNMDVTTYLFAACKSRLLPLY